MHLGRSCVWSGRSDLKAFQNITPALTGRSCDHSFWWGHNVQIPVERETPELCALVLTSHYVHSSISNFQTFIPADRTFLLLFPISRFPASGPLRRVPLLRCFVYHLSRYLDLRRSPGSPFPPVSVASVRVFWWEESISGRGSYRRWAQRTLSGVLSDGRNFGFDSRVIPRSGGRAAGATGSGSWTRACFPENLLLYLPEEPSVLSLL